MIYLIKDDCALDGNKRLGWPALCEVLAHYGAEASATDDEVEAQCLAVLTAGLDADDVADWLFDGRLTALIWQ